MISFDHIQAAAARIQGVALRTPVLSCDAIDAALGASVLFKCENLQRMGAFKFRGAYHAVVRLDEAARRRGVVAFSSGNHGLALSRVAQMLGVSATVVMPADAPAMKVEGARTLGAKVILFDRKTEDRSAIARRIVEEEGRTLIPPFDHDDVIAGQGTAAMELLQDTAKEGPLDSMIVCVGGGGFFAGCTVAAKAMQASIHMVGAEPAAGNDGEQSMREGRIVRLPEVPATICDGQQTVAIGERPFAIFREHRCEILSAHDDTVIQAMRLAFDHLKLVVEPSGACGLAVLMQHKARFASQRVGVMLSGGNVDAQRMARLFAEVPMAS